MSNYYDRLLRLTEYRHERREEGRYAGVRRETLLNGVRLAVRSITDCSMALLVHGQVTIIFVVSVGLSVCLFVCLCRVFLSRL